MRRPSSTLAAFALAVVLAASSAAAHRVLYVDPTVAQSGNGFTWATAFKTIQEAINASDGDDMVFIAPGVYQGPIRVTRGAQLYAGMRCGQYDVFRRQPLLNRVVIDARGAGRAMTMDVGCELNGLWIINGNATGDGGGLLVSGNSTFVSGCIFLNCRASGRGQAIHLQGGANAMVENCVIAYSGQGVAVTAAGGAPEFVNNLFFRNDECMKLTGAGVPVIANNSFYRNAGCGADLPSAMMTPSVENNHFDGNGVAVRRQGNDLTSIAALNGFPFAQNNLGGNPRFVDENGFDFSLEPDSPLIDTGKTKLVWSFLDINVLIRPYDDPRVRGPSSQRDIGPHEWFGTRLAARGPTSPGSSINLGLVAPSAPNRAYIGAASLGPGPITIDQRSFFLSPDPLFLVSARGFLPSVFRNFAGMLDASGAAAPTIRLPNDARLKGQVFYTAFLVLDATSPQGIRDITRTLEIVIL